MSNVNIAFGKRIKSIRVSKRISQEKTAELCGLHPTYIGQIERGEKSPTLESIYKLAIGLGVSPQAFFENIDNSGDDFASKIYNEILSLPEEQKKKLYKIIVEIIHL